MTNTILVPSTVKLSCHLVVTYILCSRCEPYTNVNAYKDLNITCVKEGMGS